MYVAAPMMLEMIEMTGSNECDSKSEVMYAERLPVMLDWKAFTQYMDHILFAISREPIIARVYCSLTEHKSQTLSSWSMLT